MTTAEYHPITCGDPRMAALHPSDVAHRFLAGALPPVDFAVSYSSLEHAGLGRYGDPLNPSADIEEARLTSAALSEKNYTAARQPRSWCCQVMPAEVRFLSRLRGRQCGLLWQPHLCKAEFQSLCRTGPRASQPASLYLLPAASRCRGRPAW